MDLNDTNVIPKYLPIIHPQLLDTKTGEVLFAMNVFDEINYQNFRNNKNSNFAMLE